MWLFRRALFAALCASVEAALADECALRFGGAQEATLPPLGLAGPHTVELWVRPRDPLPPADRPATLLSFGGGASLHLSRAGVDYRLALVSAPGAAGPPTLHRVFAAGMEAGRWRHVAASFDGRRMRLFLDGRLTNVKIAPGEMESQPRAGTAIGSGGSEGERGFVGEIDEVRWWSRARSEVEIRSDYRTKTGSGQSGLWGYYSFDEGQGQLVLDRSPAARHGMLGTTRFPEARDPAWEESSSPVRRSDPDHLLLFDPEGPLSTRTGEEFSVRCILRSPQGRDPIPLRAWSVSVSHDRLLHFLIAAGLRGTDVEPHLARGFVHFESVDGPGGTGFISRAILDEEAPGIPVTGDLTVAVATYRSLAPRGGDQAATRIRYEEGLEGSAGPSRNSFRLGGRQVFPVEGALDVAIRAPLVTLGFIQEEGIRIVPGGELGVDCLMKVAENSGEGAQSWSISVKHDPSVLVITDATTSGTIVERAGAETGVFQLTELVDNESGAGFLSAIILSIERPYSLPPNGEEMIARARYRVRADAAPGAATAIAYQDGLQQSGVPIDNLVVFLGGASQPRKGVLPVSIVPEVFVRGDLNGDRRVNLADVVGLLSFLFREELSLGCADAADLNDDGRIDVADPIFLLGALFQGARRPPAPHPLPGPDPTADGLRCERPVG